MDQESKDLLKELSQVQAVLTLSLSEQGHPNAAVWPLLHRVQVMLDDALASNGLTTLSDDEEDGGREAHPRLSHARQRPVSIDTTRLAKPASNESERHPP